MMDEKRLLVVEDEIIVAEDLRTRLKKMGYAVPSIASSGEEAIKRAIEDKPDLVLMDIVLHGKMDGIIAAGKIRENFDIPIVYLTAYADEATLKRAKITEPFGYIIKPFKERELQIAIEIALYKHRMERQLKESNQWLTSTINSVGDAVIATDMSGTIKLMNPLAEILTGWKLSEASGKALMSIFNIVSKEMGKIVEDPVIKVMREGSFFGLAENSVLVSRGGIEIPVDIIGTPIKDEKDNMIGTVVVFYDIIERKKIEASIRKVAGTVRA